MSNDTVTVTIPYAFKPSDVVAREGVTGIDMGLDGKESDVLNYLRRNPYAKISEVASSMGTNPSDIKRVMSSLREKGLLRNDGTNRNSKWTVILNGSA